MSNENESQDVHRQSNDRQGGARQKWPVRRLATVVGWCVLALAVLAGIRWKFFSPTPVAAVQMRRGELREEAFGTGTLEAKVVIALSAKIIGKVTEVLVDQGETVTAGQTLARLEARDYEDAVRSSEAALNQAQAELAKAQLDLKRDRNLVSSNAISKADVELAETAYRVADAHVKNAEAQLGFSRARLGDTQIVSPAAGLVITRNLEVGSTVVPGTPIFRVADTQVLWVQAMVDEHEAGKLRVGQTARITFRANQGESFPGRLVRLAREADRVTEEREADVAVDQLPPDWFIGAKADVYIETAKKPDALQIPKSALVRTGALTGVFAAHNGHARWLPVQLGLTGRDNVEVISGLDALDLVITDPFTGKGPIVAGQRIKVEERK
jgi:HlyD family secretion protein